MIWGIGKFTEGMQKSDEAYQTKRQKNLAFYREWRQLFPDAPIADHQSVIDTLAGGSSYLKQQLPSTEALRSYAAERDRKREIRDRELQFKHLDSKLSAYDTLKKQIKDQIGIEGSFEDMVKKVEGLYPEGSAGASIASDLMKTFEPEFKATQRNKKFKMAEQLAKAAKDVGEGDLKMVAASVGLQPTAEVLKLAEAINKNTYKKDREKGLRDLNQAMRTDPNIRFLVDRGGKSDLAQVQKIIAGEAANYGLGELNETELASLNANLNAYSAANAPRKASQVASTVRENDDIMSNLKTFMIKQGGRPDLPPGKNFEAVLKDEIAKYADADMGVVAKNLFVDNIYKQLTSRSNLNSARRKYVEDQVKVVISQNLKNKNDIANATGLDPITNSSLINDILVASQAQREIDDLNKMKAINEEVRQDDVLQQDLRSTNPSIRGMAVAQIKEKYRLSGIADRFDEMLWTTRSMVRAMQTAPKARQEEFERITTGKGAATIITMLQNDYNEAAKAQIRNMIDRMKVNGPDDRAGLADRIYNYFAAEAGAKTLDTSTKVKVNLKKAGNEYYDVTRKDLISAASKLGEGFAVSKGITDDKEGPAIGVALEAVVAQNPNLSGRNILNDLLTQAWEASNKDKDVFVKNIDQLLRNASDRIMNDKSYTGGRSNFVKSYVAEQSSDPKAVAEVTSMMENLEVKLKALPSKLQALASVPHKDKNGQTIGTDDEKVYDAYKKAKLAPLIRDIKKLEEIIASNNIIFGELPEDTGTRYKELVKLANALVEENNRVSVRLEAQKQLNASEIQFNEAKQYIPPPGSYVGQRFFRGVGNLVDTFTDPTTTTLKPSQ